ncbi:putative Methionine aminopeptidase 1 [Paratrimastix pyriformis]|uniref:Methionine aminopeptidase 1 n=1 Tax=Paratrimastix pyriformis TaxID=342808 RepID=A0ABQ8UGX0_9EUKA|nr:putative Methionine aminopeptidase 1 [Paratrimastix pyriformis]
MEANQQTQQSTAAAAPPAPILYKCARPGCTSPSATLQCPECLKLQVPGYLSHFCGPECFKQVWNSHRRLHATPTWHSDYRFTGPLRPGRITPKLAVPEDIAHPDYVDHPEGASLSEMAGDRLPIEVKTPAMIEGLRVSGRLAREVLDIAGRSVRPGITTDEIDRIVHQACIERHCYPSPLGYRLFPKSCCTSINEVICHGIPDTRPLQRGDIINVDITIYYNGYHGDLSETYLVGGPEACNPDWVKLVRTTYECTMLGISVCKPGVPYSEIGAIIEKHAHANGCAVCRDPHIMQVGHVFTIEPMINLGTHFQTHSWPDDWTAVTIDGMPSAQFEHTLVVTPTGVEIFTHRLPESCPLNFSTMPEEVLTDPARLAAALAPPPKEGARQEEPQPEKKKKHRR